MKKIIGVLFIILILLSTICFATEQKIPQPRTVETPQEEINQDETSEIPQVTDEEPENYDDLIDLISATNYDLDSDIIEDDVYEMKENVIINEDVDGNVHAMGRKVRIEDAIIYGNVFVMAQEIEIVDCEISGTIYAMGEKIFFSGNADDICAMGRRVSFEEESIVSRNANVVAKDLTIRGNIERNLNASIEQINIMDTAVIEGNLNYFSNSKGTISEEAEIEDIHFMKIHEEPEQEKEITDYVLEVVTVALKTSIIAFFILSLTNKFKLMKRGNLILDLLKSTGKGMIAFVLTPAIAILLMLSIIGTALGVSLLAIYGVLLYVATAIVAIEIAYRIASNKEQISNVKVVGIAILISIILWAVKFIPVVNGWIQFILILIGLGILSNVIFQKIKEETNNGEINEN